MWSGFKIRTVLKPIRHTRAFVRLIVRGRFTKGFDEIKLGDQKRDHSGEELFVTELQLKCTYIRYNVKIITATFLCVYFTCTQTASSGIA